MKPAATSLFRALRGVVVMLALVAGITSTPVLAASNGIYIATATPHYKHPVTGVIEDAGGDGSAVLGQSMTESATYKKALVEVDPQGNTYVTVRLKLMDNIRDPQFQVDGHAASAELMQEDYTLNTADYRMPVSSENAVIRCNMYVIAMGRDVVFYITVANLQPGSEDFVTSVKVDPTKPTTAPTATKTAQPTAAPTAAPTSAPTGNAVASPSDATAAGDPATPGAPVTPNTPTAAGDPTTLAAPDASGTPRAADAPSNAGGGAPSDAVAETGDEPTAAIAPAGTTRSDNAAAGLQEFDAAGQRVDVTTAASAAVSSPSTTVWWVLGGVLVAAAAGVCVWYFGFFRKKSKGGESDDR